MIGAELLFGAGTRTIIDVVAIRRVHIVDSVGRITWPAVRRDSVIDFGLDRAILDRAATTRRVVGIGSVSVDPIAAISVIIVDLSATIVVLREDVRKRCAAHIAEVGIDDRASRIE